MAHSTPLPTRSDAPISHYRWVVVALLFAIVVINYIDRSAISYAIDPISKELSLTASQKGLILGAFGVGYMFTTFIGGVLTDRFGPRIILTVAVILWAVSSALTAVASSFFLLLALRALLGLAEGPMFPGLTGAVAHWLSPKERAKALGYSLAAVPLALAIGGPIVSGILSLTDWRSLYWILAVGSLVWFPLWFWMFRNRPEDSAHVNEAELAQIRHKDIEVIDTGRGTGEVVPARSDNATATTWKRLFTNPTLLANYWAFFVFGYFLFFFMTWLPGFLEQKFSVSVANVGWFSFVPWAVAGVVLLLLGNLSDGLLEKTQSLRISRSWFIIVTQLIAAVVIVPVAFTSTLWVALALITVALASSMGANAVYYAINVDIAPDRSATALGLMDLFFAVSGFAAPAITGWVVGSSGSFTRAFFILAALAGSSVVLTFLFHRPDRDAIDHPYPDAR
ncbi:MFS transporter [Sagittula stellata]|uniref:Major facilitator family transporter n=1 Tax=Sagittula stellata (strain ATCC 700073 / DSM 11524 / E-37) TaxID=388399 RepID=A3K375_SAGS3|nr:MFS transporter [Sagittula stellata]EBA08634.1 major facilitator family transporter [Sagittula stellata E-37]